MVDFMDLKSDDKVGNIFEYFLNLRQKFWIWD